MRSIFKTLLALLLVFPLCMSAQKKGKKGKKDKEDDTENAADVKFITGTLQLDEKGAIYLLSSDCRYSGNYYLAGGLAEDTPGKEYKKQNKKNKKANKRVAKKISKFTNKVNKSKDKNLPNREIKCVINEEAKTMNPLKVISPMFEPVVTGLSPLCDLALIGIYALYLETERIKTMTRVVTYKMGKSDDGDVEQMLFYDKNCNAIGMDQLTRMTPEIKQVLKEANIAVLANIAAVGIILANIKAIKQEISQADLVGKIAGTASLVQAGLFQVRLLNDNKRLRDRIKECKGIIEGLGLE